MMRRLLPLAAAGCLWALAGRGDPVATAGPPLLHGQSYAPAADRHALLDAYYAGIKDSDFDFGKEGSVMEALAFAACAQKFPEPRFEILPNLEYQGAGSRTLGELDLVVLDREKARVVLVVEVKLKSSFLKSDRRARDQLYRFQSHLNEGRITRFLYNRDRKRDLPVALFKENEAYARVGNQGALAGGFEYEIDLTREEADDLRDRILIGRRVDALGR
jgi:hypothetical protein